VSQGRIEGSNTFLLPWLGAQPSPLEAETMPCVSAAQVADTVVRALTTPAAGGERFLVTSGPVHFNDYALATGAGNADTAYRRQLEDEAITFDTGKAQKLLGITYAHQDEVLGEGMRAVKAFMARQ
jgi:nucleoside-diphosphate-sugar epimerase